MPAGPGNGEYLEGDVNGDGEFNIADVNAIIDMILRNLLNLFRVPMRII